MSKYTTEVRWICESYYNQNNNDPHGYNFVETILDTAAPLVFSFNFPIFDENYRIPLEKKILRHYYTREICEETVGLWKLRLEDKLNLIMPYYNKLYESELLRFNPLYDVDLRREHEGVSDSIQNKTDNINETMNGSNDRSRSESVDRVDNRSRVEDNDRVDNRNRAENRDEERRNEKDGINDVTDNVSKNESIERNLDTSNSSVGETTNRGSETNVGSGKSNSEKWDLYSDTPQGGINGIVDDAVIDAVSNNTYLTNARKITEDNENQSSGVNDYEGKERNLINGTESERGTIDTETTEGRKSYNVSNENEKGSLSSSIKENESGSANSHIKEVDSSTSDSIVSESVNDRAEEVRTRSNIGKVKLNNTDAYTEHVLGKQSGVSYSKLLKEFRETFLRIDMRLIEELNDLFF